MNYGQAVSPISFIDSEDVLASRALDRMLGLAEEGVVLVIKDSDYLNV